MAISIVEMPSDQTSDRGVLACCEIASGAMYLGVPVKLSRSAPWGTRLARCLRCGNHDRGSVCAPAARPSPPSARLAALDDGGGDDDDVLSLKTSNETPRSHSLTSPVGATKILAGLMSRWI